LVASPSFQPEQPNRLGHGTAAHIATTSAQDHPHQIYVWRVPDS
jgi:hypothetical protein